MKDFLGVWYFSMYKVLQFSHISSPRRIERSNDTSILFTIKKYLSETQYTVPLSYFIQRFVVYWDSVKERFVNGS